MSTVTLESNALSVAEILIPDMGIVIPPGGGVNGSDDFTESAELRALQESTSLRTLASDDAYGAGEHSIIVKDEDGDVVDPSVLDAFLSGITEVVDPPTQAARDSSNSNLVYVGRALSGATTDSDAEWQIYRIDINQLNGTQVYADGDKLFDNVWTNRESLSYS